MYYNQIHREKNKKTFFGNTGKVEKIEEYYPNNKLKSVKKFEGNKIIFTIFDVNGDVIQETTITNGEISGEGYLNKKKGLYVNGKFYEINNIQKKIKNKIYKEEKITEIVLKYITDKEIILNNLKNIKDLSILKYNYLELYEYLKDIEY